jgi:hypothetical protein
LAGDKRKMQIMLDETCKITPKQFDVFKKEVARWIKKLGLTEWRLIVELDMTDDSCEVQGYCRSDKPNRTATVGLVRICAESPTNADIKHTARHEVLELMLQPLWHVAVHREFNIENGHATRHEVISRLENLFDRDD